MFRTWPDSPEHRLDFAELRAQLFRTTGYCVVKGFCSRDEASQIRRFWHQYPMAVEPKGYWRDRANYSLGRGPAVQRYECMFWNPPEHPLTYELAWSALLLRNVVWGLPLHTNVLAFEGSACSYRVTRSDVGDSGVRQHNDSEEWAALPHRLQVSVALSTMGEDFTGGGTRLRTRSGAVVNIHEIHGVRAGDLILFDQLLEHSVDAVSASNPSEPLSGHWRLLMPDHPVAARKPWRWPHALQRLESSLRRMASGGRR